MDCTNSKFSVNCESNPAFFKQCAVQWLDSWSKESMLKVMPVMPRAVISSKRRRLTTLGNETRTKVLSRRQLL